MTKFPPISGKQVCRMLGKIGYSLDHQTGSHLILRKDNPPFRRITVPNHKEIAKRILRANSREAGLSVEEFLAIK